MNRAQSLSLGVAIVLGFGVAAHAAQPAQERFIVVLNPNAGPPAAIASELAQRTNGRIGFVYENALRGFSISLPAPAIIGLQHDPRVQYVEVDNPVQIFAQSIPTGLNRIYQPDTLNVAVGELFIDGVDDMRVDADVAVIDTGIDFEHPDLNVVGGTDCTYMVGGGPPWARHAECQAGGDDDHYHGTHVAGTIGALDNNVGTVGVAPGARLWAVKVLDSNGGGYESNVVAGIDWVHAHAGEIEVANMSLGGAGYSQAEQDAISNTVAAGVVFVVAAGNDNADVAGYSPAGLDDVLAVSALADFDGRSGGQGTPTCRADQDDTLADFSNWGSRVAVAAPGVCITSTYPLEKGEYGTISGTSMASPHVAGAAALLASGANKPQGRAGVASLVNQLVSSGNYDWTDDSGDAFKEPLLDITGYTPAMVPSDGGGANAAPTASFSYGCADLICDFDATASADIDGVITRYDWDFGDGSSDSGAVVSHSFAAAGDYTVVLTVTDDIGDSGTAAQSITVAQASAGALHVGDLDASATTAPRGKWNAEVAITVREEGGNPVGSATVSGSWNGGVTGRASCTTDAEGQCRVTKNNIKSNVGSLSFTVDAVVHATLSYDALANTDPDGDSDGTTIMVQKP